MFEQAFRKGTLESLEMSQDGQPMAPGMSGHGVEGLRWTDRQICCCPGLNGSLGARWAEWVYICSRVGLRSPRAV